MSTLAELFPAGAGKEVNFTASGAIAAAKPVILNSTGTVTQVAAPNVAEDIPLGDIWLYNNATNNRGMGDFPSHSCVPIIGEADTMVEAKKNGSSYPCIAIAKRDPSDNSMTLGAQTVVSSNAINGLSIAHDPTTGNERRGIVAYNYAVSSTKTAFANVYTITGSGSSPSDYSISIGSVAQLTNNISSSGSILKMDPHTAGRFFYSYIGNYQGDPWQQFQGQTMGLVTGTSIGSIASAFIESSGNMSIYFGSNIMDFDPNTANKLLICYGVYGLPFPTSHYDRMQGRVGILSSSTDYTPSWGTAVVFNSSSSNDTYKSMAWLHQTADRAIAFYMDGAASSKAKAVMLTIGSGTSTSITVGSTTYFNDTYSKYHHILVDPDTDTILTCWDDNSSNKYLHHRTATVNTSTGAFTLGTEHETMHSGTPISNQGNGGAICWDGALNGIFWQHGRMYEYNDDKNWLGMGRISKDVTNLTSTNVIGVSKAAISDTASGTVVLKGGLVTDFPATPSPSAGAVAQFESGNPNVHFSMAYDSNANKSVVFYKDSDNNNYGTASVGTVSGTTSSWGTPVVFNSQDTTFASDGGNTACFDSDANKVVVAYRDSSRGAAIVGTISGTSISFGSEGEFNSGTTTNIGAAFDSTANKVLVAYRDDSNSDASSAAVGTVSGTGISFGSEVVFRDHPSPGRGNKHVVVYDPDQNKSVIFYAIESNGNGACKVVTISGTTPSFGTEVVFKAANIGGVSPVYDSNANKVVVHYSLGNSPHSGHAAVGTISGTSISFGTEATAHSGSTSLKGASFNSTDNTTLMTFVESVTTFDGWIVIGTVSGTDISFGTTFNVTDPNNANPINVVYDSTANKTIMCYRADSVGRAKVISGTTPLTPASDYYAQSDGTISTTSTSPAVKLGRALSGTILDLEYQS